MKTYTCILNIIFVMSTGCSNPSVIEPMELPLNSQVVLSLVKIPAGEFMMGVKELQHNDLQIFHASPNEQPCHMIKITRPFYITKYEITVEQFDLFIKETGCSTVAEIIGGYDSYKYDVTVNWHNPGFKQTKSHPVVCIAYDDALAFCQWASKKTNRIVRLPTEAEWEYACRAGTNTYFIWGNEPEKGKGWVNGRDEPWSSIIAAPSFNWNDGFQYTAPVGFFKPNQWGLYDMDGNVSEWCMDWYSPDYYKQSPLVDPEGPKQGDIITAGGGGRPIDEISEKKGPLKGMCRVVRGGSYLSTNGCMCSARGGQLPYQATTTNGFRVVVEVENLAPSMNKGVTMKNPNSTTKSSE